MLERSHIQSSGFGNLPTEGGRQGFRVRIRQPNYRGTRVSLLEGIEVTVDGERFAAEDNRYVIDGREYAHADLDTLTDLRWPVGTTLDVIVGKPGGLEPGVHLVETIVYYRHPYFPPQFRPIPVRDSRHATIVL
jgi:hypothetical protein